MSKPRNGIDAAREAVRVDAVRNTGLLDAPPTEEFDSITRLEVRERAFEPFFTTKPEGSGTGLGPSMVYGIVKQRGGEIRLLSKANEGTTIQMLFPVVGSAAELASVSTSGGTVGGSETILLVEDQPASRLRETSRCQQCPAGCWRGKRRRSSSAPASAPMPGVRT